jgi:hypothetical protein
MYGVHKQLIIIAYREFTLVTSKLMVFPKYNSLDSGLILRRHSTDVSSRSSQNIAGHIDMTLYPGS